MCNHTELIARRSAVARIRKMIEGLDDIQDRDARREVRADILEILKDFDRVIDLKLQTDSDNGTVLR